MQAHLERSAANQKAHREFEAAIRRGEIVDAENKVTNETLTAHESSIKIKELTGRINALNSYIDKINNLGTMSHKHNGQLKKGYQMAMDDSQAEKQALLNELAKYQPAINGINKNAASKYFPGIGYIVNSQCATTECADGTFSTSTHPNACSHHGGIKNRVQKPSTPTPAAYNPAEVYFVPLNKIFTAEHLFQNRKESHSQESANRIIKAVETGSFKWQVFDPVLLWQNPADNKLYILSGHSRTAAFRILAQQKAQADGKDFTSIPAKIIRTTEAEAREIALNSNTLATKENDTERAAYYRNLRESGKDMREIYALAKDNEGRNANAIMAYSCLNPDGKAFQSLLALETADLTSRKIAETVAIWLGSARSKFGLLTNQHENELYDWLIMGAYGNKPGQISNQNDFLGRVQATIDKRSTFGNFEADKPLNIRNIQTQSSYDLELDQVRQEIAQAQKTLTEKRREFIQRGATGTALENVLKPYQDGVNYYSQKLIKMQQDKGNIKQHERAQLEMFGFKNRR
ncbi:MAG: hypothetical protein ACXWXW_00760, partial [Bacteroidia bacterium]